MEEFEPKNWFWIVGGDETRAWSSAAASYVTDWPADRITRIANEVELYDALARIGCKTRAPVRTFSVAEVRNALSHIDATATGDANDAATLSAVADEIGFILPPMAP
jgi:hypothetical protein